uniref:Major facilitator superfamily (MFS) profile domain-containing protein n=1 Tax=Plectus sambesii TaxID=2011161 RepID=A0A914WPC7_9BILA
MSQRAMFHPHYRLLFSSCFHALLGTSAFHFTTCLNPVEEYVQTFANNSFAVHYGLALNPVELSWLWSTIACMNAVGAFVGSLLLQYPAELIGRRYTVMIVKNVIQVLAAVLQFSSVSGVNSVEMLIIGRFLGGVACAFSMFIPVFLAECAPADCRGLVATIAFAGVPVWNTIGATTGLQQLLGTPDAWHYVLLIPAIPALVHMCMTSMFPESPKFLFITEMEGQQAKNSIMFYHGSSANVKEAMQVMQLESKLGPVNVRPDESATLRRILQTPHLRIPLFICLVTNAATSFGGSDIVLQYSASAGFLNSLGVPPLIAPWLDVLILQVPGIVVMIIASVLVERTGRRPLLLWGIGLGVVATGGLFAGSLFPKGSVISALLGITGMFLSVVGFYIGPSYISTILPSEMCPQNSRALSTGIAFGFGWIPSILIIVGYPPLDATIGAYSVLPLVILGAASFVYLYFYLPETKGKDVDEIVRLWLPRPDPEGRSNESTPLLGNSHKFNTLGSLAEVDID